jgi:hypothetical protein
MNNHQGLLEGFLQCSEHGCPMIQIGNDYVCVFEYVDSCIGNQQVVDVITDIGAGSTETDLLVFENGWQLPLLCPACGGPIQTCDEEGDATAFLEAIVGLYLTALSYLPAEGSESPEGLALSFAVEPDARPHDDWAIVVHLNSVRGMRQP